MFKLKNVGIGPKIYILVGLLMAFGGLSSMVALVQMNKIGGEITEIAEHDLPLTSALSNITIHQLEQAVILEKALREGGVQGHGGPSAQKDLEREYIAFGETITKEIKFAEELAEESIATAHSAEALAEFQHILEVLTKIETSYATYEKHAEEVLHFIDLGDINGASKASVLTEKEMEVINHELIALLIEVEKFTEQAAVQAEHDELFAIKAILFVTVVSLLLGAGLAFIIARSVSVPIRGINAAMNELSKGNLDHPIPADDRKDEVGEMAKTLKVFRDNTAEMKRLEAEQIKAEERAREEQHQAMLKMADDFEASVGGVVNAVSSASTEMQSSASSLSATAEQTSKQSATVAAASEEASTNVQTVASASEELSSSISEISRQVSESTQIAGAAVAEVDGANEKVQGLATAAQKIGEVVALITDIADQTNLLALNATIEAARAGEAGKGFAVVASEVKNLANATAKATEEISTQIGDIQSATEGAVAAIGSIGGTIAQMNEIASTIAAAVEQQGAATQEIARNVEQAAAGTNEVSSNITGVNQAATDTGQSASELLSAATELSQQSEMLRSEVDTFLVNVRTG